MTYRFSGQCQCSEVCLTIELPEPLKNFSPRQCDCDFCMARDIRYLSHPEAVINVKTSVPLRKQQQGSNQAEFLTCGQCETVVAVCCQFDDSVKGAVNTNVLDDKLELQQATVASPKLLKPQEKYQRWQTLWAKVEGL